MRLPYIPPAELSPDQRAIFEDMKSLISSRLPAFHTETPDGALMGPWNPWLHEPRIGGTIWSFVKAVTVETTLPEEARQIAILAVGAHFKAAYELYAHVALSEAGGMNKAKIAAIVAGSRPANLTEVEAAAYDVAHSLVSGGVLPAIVYSQALNQFGQHSLNELIYLVGAYCLVSVTLNGFNVPVPEND
jgi:4-carboxymuconolactone decarboxylase